MVSDDNAASKLTRVWADVGGTFTDVIVASGSTLSRESDCRAIKVLSSGTVTARCIEIAEEDGQILITVALPIAFAWAAFWVGARVRCEDAEHGTRVLGSITGSESLNLGEDEHHVRLRVESPVPANVRGLFIDRVILDPEIEAPVLGTRLLLGVPLRDALPSLDVRLGTTRGTNALLTRGGARVALLVTEGFGDVLRIGNQDRPELFALTIRKPVPLTEEVMEIRERLDADGRPILALDEEQLQQVLADLRGDQGRRDASPEVIVVCLLHASKNPTHEQRVVEAAKRAGFQHVIASSDVAPLPRFVPRCQTAVLDGYLQPILDAYTRRVEEQFTGNEPVTGNDTSSVASTSIHWMTSSGNLAPRERFRGSSSVLSGPAGGVVGLGKIAESMGVPRAIGLDMGGTSTDVARYDQRVGRRFETNIGGVQILAPMMDIHTVAAGGGSICDVREGRLTVGPESAGAEPGPACYGRGGPLTITDVNLILGRLPTERFPIPLDREAAERALEGVLARLPSAVRLSREQLAEGFLKIAITEMAEAVRTVTTAGGHDPRTMTLVGFGGAAGGHLCRVADELGIREVVDHPLSGLLSAYGIGNADLGTIATESFERTLGAPAKRTLESIHVAEIRDGVSNLCARNHADLETSHDAGDSESLRFKDHLELDLRYRGTQSSLSMEVEPIATLLDRFEAEHERVYGYQREDMAIESVALRCESWVSTDDTHRTVSTSAQHGRPMPGQVLSGPCVIGGDHSVLVIEPGWQGVVRHDGLIHLTKKGSGLFSAPENDVVAMEVAARRVQGIAEAMGETICRTSVSVNVKERRDFSCAVFLGDGALVANAPHVPVHLGAMGHVVKHLLVSHAVDGDDPMQPGDLFVSNHPFRGGSHLPDVTVVTPVFVNDESRRPDFFVASRCHHAEIGGMTPGSMSPEATRLSQEGILIDDFRFCRAGERRNTELAALLTAGPFPTRNLSDNLADIEAAVAAGHQGASAIENLVRVSNENAPDGPRFTDLMQRLLRVAGDATERWIRGLGSATRRFDDQLDDGTSIQVTLIPDQEAGRLAIDFKGTGDVHPHGFNATPAIVSSAILYSLRCCTGTNLPLCDGVLDRIDIRIPNGLLNPPAGANSEECPAVVAGNVETSNRVVDVVLGALGVAAASQGTMNNLLVGDEGFGYYETIGGGAGATADGPGADAVHTHMTNTRITDPEVLESRLPLRLWRFAVRDASGGEARHRGGHGMIREIEFLKDLSVSMITSRRETSPYGMNGGSAGSPGRQELWSGGKWEKLPTSFTRAVQSGWRLRIQTPGGGGWGS
ncbi:MAG: hydantoinase B/oxoprolinase family protein [Planctomycetota bacterium]